MIAAIADDFTGAAELGGVGYVKSATELALAGKVGGIVTSAINKEALHAAG